MILRRLDDYQGWQVTFQQTSILIDPWLTGESITGSFDRHSASSAVSVDQLRSEPGNVAAIALCTAVSDHARPATLAALAEVPVLGPARAARLARKAGSVRSHALRPGQRMSFPASGGGRIEVTATRTGLPLGLIAIGYLIEAIGSAGESMGRIWIEPHQPTDGVGRSLAPVDLALLPMQSVTATVLPVTAGPKASLAAARACGARAIVPTATDPGRDMTGWQRRLYRVSAPAAQPSVPVLELAAAGTVRVPVNSSV